ncbi:hypothetical protein [Marinomonas balearica]|uniref:Baseplate J-like protein n=1 Tax=Marinomonas balearica TaxID=491947 RepID=A0A4R6M968_9GAMM|nr:hypothetical protein [Marinomonas balearica]TDO96699.1 hypothetical protein DFP79_2462 [Marinomonas balearica]
MSETIANIFTKKTLSRATAGVTQSKRQLDAMAASYYAIEERSFSQWMSYLREASKQVQYYDTQTHLVTDHWSSSLPTEIEALGLEALLKGDRVTDAITELASRPDIAVLLAFFTLMAYPKQQFTDFTELHKQHYYQDVLGFKPNGASLDQVNLVLSLSDSVKSMTLPAGTRFNGGSDVNDEPLIYQTLANAVINHAQVARMDTLSGIQSDQRVLTRHIHLDDGLALSEEGALTFGDKLKVNEGLTEQQSFSQVGFTLASPCLYLSGGKRVIKLAFERSENAEVTPLLLDEWFDIAVSTGTNIQALDSSLETPEAPAWSMQANVDDQGRHYDLVLTFSDQFPAITGLEGDLDSGVSPLPHLRFMLKAQKHTQANVLSKRIFNQLHIDIEVSELEGVIADNHNGALDTTGPIEPFGFQPLIGNRFTFTHPELLVKQISKACLTLNWLGRPQPLADYYKAYQDYRVNRLEDENSNWVMPLLLQSRSDSIDALASVAIFETDSNIVNNLDSRTMTFIKDDAEAYANGALYEWEDLPFTQEKASLWPKYYGLTLSENDFGHGDYSQVSQYIAYENAKILQGDSEQKTTQIMPPYTPQLDSIKVSYHSSTSISMSALSTHEPPLLQQIHPIGRPAIPQGSYVAFLPTIAESAYLYLGLKNVSTPSQVRLYFQIDPVDATNISDDYFADWRYLSTKGFQGIPSSALGAKSGEARILEDSTQQLLNSGVVSIELPELEPTLSGLDDGLLWLQLSIYNGNDEPVSYSKIRGVYCQGVLAELVDDGIDASHFTQPLPALSISDLVTADPQISEVLQPWPSFGASAKETDTQLSIRASERLRHKQRALTIWDYEHLVLNQFPEVYLARCYVPQASDKGAADIELMLVPVNYDSSILQPKLPLYMHDRIQTFIASVCPPDLDIKVRDPIYEEVTFDVALKIYSGFDIDSVVSSLSQKLIDYLTPWQNVAGNNLVQFRQSIHLTALAAMLEQDDAVDVVHYLKAAVTKGDITTRYDSDNNVITPSSESAILVPSRTQKIILVDQDVAIMTGVGKWRIELDFTVN